MDDKSCIFCDIIKKKIPSKILYENEHCLAFLDISPLSEGHSIVIPKAHYHNMEDISESELVEVFKVVKKIATHIYKQLGIGGYNILQNNFEPAGQVVKHFHIHIIPRNQDDKKFTLKIPRKQATEKELEEIFLKLKL